MASTNLNQLNFGLFNSVWNLIFIKTVVAFLV